MTLEQCNKCLFNDHDCHTLAIKLSKIRSELRCADFLPFAQKPSHYQEKLLFLKIVGGNKGKIMKKVYVVTTGEYSDYSIKAIFTTKALAQECIDTLHDGDIEEYILDLPKNPPPIIDVRMAKEGGVLDSYRYNEPYREQRYGFICFDRDHNLIWGVRTDSKKRATKVVNEKRIQILAHDIWGDEDKVRELFSQKLR